MKKALVIFNPNAGTKTGNKNLAEILGIFAKGGYRTEVSATLRRGHATEIAKRLASKKDLIVCIGGDGTFNEVAAGVMESETDVPIGYIPAGSTNDFASSLNIPKDNITAARDIVSGKPGKLDMGMFNGRFFSYVASFGAFTKTSYSVSQDLKNMIGHTAYVIEGIKELSSIKKLPLTIRTENREIKDDFLFGAVCNSTSMGGILTLHEDDVDMNDGLFEVLLIHAPKNILDFNKLMLALTTQSYKECESISFFSASSVEIEANEDMDWTLDGEYQKGSRDIKIECIKSAIKVIRKQQYGRIVTW